MSAKVQPLLALDSAIVDPASADCAIFYSITNPQEGLRGISFGNLLIKQVAEDLGREFPRLKTFATLSPIPGFRKWLTGGTGLREGDPRHAELAALLAKLDVPDWFKDKLRAAEILKQLSRLCAYYLLYAKQDDEPLDPVARFHLANGARLERLNWLGDISVAGMRSTAECHVLKMLGPPFLEGEAGVGKTVIANVLASGLGRPLVRLQCYEGLDIASAVYEWNYSRQMIEIRLAETQGTSRDTVAKDIFSERFLIKRPLMQALEGGKGAAPVLLIDELDRTDEPFEAYLLEVLSDFQITIPEIGTVRATEPPIVVLTSNRTREIHDAIKRRCFYHWVDYPDAARELEILKRKAPEASEILSREVVTFVQRLRKMDLFKLPGVAETIDWSKALVALDKMTLDPQTVNDTLGTLLKYQDDITRVRGSDAERLLAEVRAELAAA